MSIAVRPVARHAEWTVWTTTARVVVTDAAALEPVRTVTERVLADVDRAASRFRDDSEVSVLARRRRCDGVAISPMLAALLRVALEAAQLTEGAVDPTLGQDLVHLGYGGSPRRSGPTPRRASWRDVDVRDLSVSMPAGTLLDLGATAKAYAADLAATVASRQVGCGVLVSLGGDLRVAGPEPIDGWQILVQDGPDEPPSRLQLVGASAVATSSVLHRRWKATTGCGGREAHHILDPETRTPAASLWRTVSVAADSCVRANTWSTAALVGGARATTTLAATGLPARLVAADGTVTVSGGWPA